MATNPTQTSTQGDPWKDVTAEDLLTDPNFYKLSKEARKLAITKVWPEFGTAEPGDQEETLNAKVEYWQKYYAPEVPKEKGFLEKAGDFAKYAGQKIEGFVESAAETIGKTEMEANLRDQAAANAISEPVKKTAKSVKDLFTPLPKEFGQPPSIESLIVEQKKNKKFPGQIAVGNVDLASRPVTVNSDGSQSTVFSRSFGVDGKVVLVPSVAEDGSRQLSADEAWDLYKKTGKNLGTFKDEKSAKAYADRLHKDYAEGRIKNTEPFTGKLPEGTRVEWDPIKASAAIRPEFKNTEQLKPSVETGGGEWGPDVTGKYPTMTEADVLKFWGDTPPNINLLELGENGIIRKKETAPGTTQVPRVQIINGLPYETIVPKVNLNLTSEKEQMEINSKRLREGKQLIPFHSGRTENAITSALQGYANGLPSSIKSLAAMQHMTQMGLQTGVPGEEIPIPRLEDGWLYKIGADIQNRINEGMPLNPEFQNDFWTTVVPQGLGSTLFFYTIGALGGVAGAPAGAMTAGSGALVQMGPMYEQAYLNGASREELFATAIAGIGLGATEAIPVERAFKRLDDVTGGFALKWLRSRMLRGPLKGGVNGWIEEFTQETFQNLGQDWVQTRLPQGYDPNTGLQNVPQGALTTPGEDFRQGLAGGVSGAVFSSLMSAMGVATARLHMRSALANASQQYKAQLEASGDGPATVEAKLAVMKSNQNKFIRRLENEQDEAARKAEAKVEEYKKLTGTEAVMILKPDTGEVLSVKSKEDYNKQKAAEIGGLLGISSEEIEKMLAANNEVTSYDIANIASEQQRATEEQPGDTPAVDALGNTPAAVTAQMIDDSYQQARDLSNGQRKAFVLPIGMESAERKAAISAAGPGSRVYWTMQGAVVYDPDQIDTKTIQQMMLDGKMEELTAFTSSPASSEGSSPNLTTERSRGVGVTLSPVSPTTASEQGLSPLLSTIIASPVNGSITDQWTLSDAGNATMEVTFRDDSVYIDQVRVAPEAQRQGIASAIYQKLGQMMKERGIPGTAIDGNIQGDPAIIQKLRAKAAAIAGDGTQGQSRYDLDTGDDSGTLDEPLPFGTGTEERRVAERPNKVDRRKDLQRRKAVDEMSREELVRELITDDLTGLRNRSAWERAPFRRFVASIDLDKMKRINDTYGFEEGDRYLRHAGEGFAQSGIAVYRLGGDDFVVKGNSVEEIASAMNKAKAWFDSHPFKVGGEDLNLNFTYGVDESPDAAFKAMKKAKDAAIARGEIEARYEKPLPKTMAQAPFIPDQTIEPPPVPPGKNPFDWYENRGFEPNGARKSVVEELVWTPMGLAEITEEDEDAPAGMVTVESQKFGKMDFNVRDTILLDADAINFDSEDFELPKPHASLKVGEFSRFKGMNGPQLYSALREKQAARLFALKRAEYTQDEGIPGWRASNIQFLSREYEAGWKDISDAFGVMSAIQMRSDIEVPMNDALGIKMAPHVKQGLPSYATYQGTKEDENGNVVGFTYVDNELLAKGASREEATITINSTDNLVDMLGDNDERYNEKMDAIAEKEKELEELKKKTADTQTAEIETRLARIRELEGYIIDPEVSENDKKEYERVLETLKKVYEGQWDAAAKDLGAEVAGAARREMEKKFPQPTPKKVVAEKKLTGPLAEHFTTDLTINPTVLPTLQNNMKAATAAGVSDDIILSFIAGKTKQEIEKEIMSKKADKVKSAIMLRVWISSMKQLKAIPDTTSPNFAKWQESAIELMKKWARTVEIETTGEETRAPEEDREVKDSEIDAISYGPFTFVSGLQRSPSDIELLRSRNKNVPIGVAVGDGISANVISKLVDHVKQGGKLFLDSGAFTDFKKGRETDWAKILGNYYYIISGLTQEQRKNVWIVAPDVIGDQSATLALQAEFFSRGKFREFQGSRFIIPIQKGGKSLTEEAKDLYDRAYGAQTDTRDPEELELKPGEPVFIDMPYFEDIVLGIPFNASAWTAEDVLGMVRATNGTAYQSIHLLGAGPKKIVEMFKKIGEINSELNVTGDAAPRNRVRESTAKTVDDGQSKFGFKVNTLTQKEKISFTEAEREVVLKLPVERARRIINARITVAQQLGEDSIKNTLIKLQGQVYLNEKARGTGTTITKVEVPGGEQQTNVTVEAPGTPTPATEGPDAVDIKETDNLAKLRERFKKKAGARTGQEMALPEEGAAPELEEMLNDPEMMEILVGIGEEYHKQGVADPAQWHASLYAEIDSMASGLGKGLEPIFPMVWEAITGDSTYAGGIGGIYGTQEGVAVTEPGSLPTSEGETGVAHGGVQPGTVEGFGGLGPAPGIPGGEIGAEPTGIPGSTEGGNVEPTGGGAGEPGIISPTRELTPRESGTFFELTPEVGFGAGGWNVKLEQNIDAIKLVNTLRKEGRAPTYDEKLVLARFIGWGALWRVLDPQYKQYQYQRQELRHLMSPEEWASAQRSTQNAYYTAEPIARSLWGIVERLGFHGGGNIMEGAAGVGVILGTAPDNIANTSNFFGTELDPITAQIVNYLYPAAKIFPRGFQELEFPDNTVDLALSNVPFGGKIFDKRYESLSPAIHDYYFLKTIDKLRPGGIMIYITSIYTMDKKSDHIRRMLSDKADLVAALRMPNGAFMSNAGTGVATDIIILQKRLPGQEHNGNDWVRSNMIKVNDEVNGGETDINLNEYYQLHPENVFGRMARGRGLTSSADPIVIPPGNVKNEHLNLAQWSADKVMEALDRLPKDIYTEPTAENPRETVQFLERFADSSVWEKQIIIAEDGTLQRKVNGFLQPLEEDLAASPTTVELIKDLIGVREALWELFRTQLTSNDEESLQASQKVLNSVYDSFLDKWKGAGSKGADYLYLSDRKIKAAFGADPTFYFLVSLEEQNQDDGSVTKSPIFRERSMRPSMPLETLPTDLRQAMLMIYAHRGYLDLGLAEKLSDKSAADWENDLREAKLIFKNPVTGTLELAEDYLSGDIYDKIEDVEKGLPMDPTLILNLDALKEVLPDRVLIKNDKDPMQQFEARLGTNWIPDNVYEDFIRSIFENDELEITIGRSKAGGYTVKIKGGLSDYIRFRKWGTDRKPAEQLIVLAMNQKKPVVYDEVDDRMVRNVQKTKEAQLVQTKIREEFVKWAREAQHAEMLEELYNRTFNRVKLRTYDGSHLQFEGMNRSVLRHGNLEPHQYNAVWRVILEGKALLAHFVGSGKTFEMAAAAMEMRRLGLVKKNMISVPKNIYRQFGADFARLYPGAKLLVVDEKDFEAGNRKKLFARIAMEDWDAVIISHEQLAKIPMSPERLSRMINEEIDELEEQIKSMGKPANKTQVTTLKRLQKRLDDYRAQLLSLLSLSQDDTVYFDNMGVDMLMVDEAHAYKNLPILTAMGNIAGIGSGSSKRAMTLKAKTDFILEKNNGRGVVFATGTPVSNSMVELYNFNKFLDPYGLRNSGVRRFDAWAANFGEVKLIVGIGPDGRNLRPQTVFGEFTNLTELQQMFRKYADVITRDMINLPIPEQINENGDPDRPTVVKVTPDAETDEFFEQIARRLRVLDQDPNFDKKLDNILWVMNDARLGSLDMRLINTTASDNPDSKANRCVRMMAEYYHEHMDDRRTQIAFTGNYQNSKNGFNLYNDMKKKLVEAGVPASQIAVIHEYKKDEDIKSLYKQIREGHIRILLTTKKTSEGANIQTRLGRLYHLDAPWTPKEIEQREGRILRQGNLHFDWNEPVQVVQFVTERTLDSRLFEILRRKARFIRQYLKGDSNVRKAADPAAKVVVTYEMISAEASGNPEYLIKVQLEQQAADLEILRERHIENQRKLRHDLNFAETEKGNTERRMNYAQSVADDFESQRAPFLFKLDGKEYTDPDDAIDDIRKKLATGVPNPKIQEGKPLEEGEPEMVPYKPFASGRYVSPEEAIAKINYHADPQDRDFQFNAVIAGVKVEKQPDAITALEAAAIKYKDVEGTSLIDFEVYGFPAQLRLGLTRKQVGKKGEIIETRQIILSFMQEGYKTIDSVSTAIPSIVHTLHDMKRRIVNEQERLVTQKAEIKRIKEGMGKPWPEQAEYEEIRQDLRDVNGRLGLSDPDEEGSIVTEESGEAVDLDDGDAETEAESDEDDDEFNSENADQFFDVMSPYTEIGVPATRSLQGNTRSAVSPRLQAQADALPARVPKPEIQKLPEIRKEAEPGPEFLYSQELTPEIEEALNNGLVPIDINDNLKTKANRRLAKIQRVSTLANGQGWEVSDGITLIQFHVYDNNGVRSIQAWDSFSYGRIQIPELLYLIEQITGNPLGMNKKLRTALGHFIPIGKGGLIELRPDLAYEIKDREQLARTLAHELGHAIDYAPDSDMAKGNLLGRILSLHKFLRQTFNLNGTTIREKELQEEFTKLSDYWRPWDQANAPKWYSEYRASPEELYADFISAILNSPGTAERLAPVSYRIFHRELDRKPEAKDVYVKVRLLMEGDPENILAHRQEQINAMFRASEDIENNLSLKKNRRSLWKGLRDDYDDRRWELKQRQARAIKAGVYSPMDDNNPLYLWDELPSKLITSNYRYQEKVHDVVVAPLEAVGLGFRDLNNYLFLARAATERKNMFNPKIGLGEYAYPSIDHMSKTLGPEKMKLIEKAAALYHDLRWELVIDAMNSGIYSEDLVEKVFEPTKYSYVKFTPIEFVKDWVDPHVKNQTGFAGNLAGPFTETLKMDRALIYLTARNNAVKASLDMLRDYYPEDIKVAFRTNAGKKERAIWAAAPEGMALVEVMEGGHAKGYYVDQYIADGLNNVSCERVDWGAKIIQFYNRKYFWKVAILYNFGFGLYGNPSRDFWRNYRLLPQKTAVVGDLVHLLWEYAKATPHVAKWMWKSKHRDTLVNEMVDAFAYTMPLSDLAVEEENPYLYELKKAGIIGQVGTLNKPKLARVFYRGLQMLGAPMKVMMQGGEMAGKLVNYTIRKELGETGKGLAFNVRNFASTPNYDVKGKYQDTANSWFIFSTIMKESWKSEYIVATDPKTRAGYWFRTSKVLFLKVMQVLAELGALNAWFGDDLEKKYKSASSYDKKNFILIPWGHADESGKVGFVKLPMDETSRFLGAILRDTIITMKEKDPRWYEELWKDVSSNFLPSFSPAVTSVAGIGDFFKGTNFLDGFRQTPIFSDEIQKARGWERNKRMLLWLLNENGLGQFATYDDSTQTKYQMWTQFDPVIGRLFGRVYKVTNYGLVEEKKKQLWMKEHKDKAALVQMKNSSKIVREFYNIRVGINRDDLLVSSASAMGGSPKEAREMYPDSMWSKLFAATSKVLSVYQKKIEAIEADPKLTDREKELQIMLWQDKMDQEAMKTLLRSGKIKPEKLPAEFSNPPSME